jgi:hypothetical protein
LIKVQNFSIYLTPRPLKQSTSSPSPFSSRRRGVFPLLEERVRVRYFCIFNKK